MKKFVALFLIVTCLVAAIPSFAFNVCGEALWALSDSQHITGILTPDKVEEYLPAQNPPKPYIVGFLDNGLVRTKGLQEYCVSTSGAYGGFTYVRTKIDIFAQYEEIVCEIVTDKLGYEPRTVVDYILATMYFECKYAGHRFFDTKVSKFHVGNVIVNDGKDTIALYMGDWDFDGKYDLGFAVGYVQCTPAPRPTCPVVPPCRPRPTPKPKQKPCKPEIIVQPEIVVRPQVVVVEPKVQAPKVEVTCKPKVCTPFVQINLFSDVTNNIKIGNKCTK